LISVREFAIEDKLGFYDFLSTIWPTRSAEVLDKRWWWQYELPPILLAQDEAGLVVGVCACIPFDLHVSPGDERRGAWIVDFFVHPSKQGLGIGGSLVKAAASRYGFLASLNQTDAALGAFKRLGWSDRSIMPLYICPSAHVSSALAMKPSRKVRASMEELEFGSEYDDLWMRSRDAYAPLTIRNARSLAERLSLPNRRYQLLTVRSDGRLDGYFVLRTLRKGSVRSFPKRDVLLVVDYVVAPGRTDVFAALLREALCEARRSRIHHVMCAAIPERFQRVLQRAGFIGPHFRSIHHSFGKLGVGFTASSEAPVDDEWMLTPLDCDMDLILDSA
jgi:GNAT superfamily N-acetyltransferase